MRTVPRDLAEAVSIDPFTALGDELGTTDPSAADGLPRLYRYRSLSDLVCDLAGGPDADPRGDADCRALLTNLRVTLAELASTPDYADGTLTAALLDLETRGLVDILGPQADDDLAEVRALLALPDGTRLSDDQLRVLCGHLSAGPGQVTDETAARLRMEYPHLSATPRDLVVRAFVDVCLQAEVVPDREDPLGRSFEWYCDTLRLLMASASVAEDQPDRARAAVGVVWSAWSPLLDDPAVGPKMLYGAVRLFALAADLELAAELTAIACDHYRSHLALMTAHWRTPAGAAELPTRSQLVGWGESTFVVLCLSLWRLQTPGLEGALTEDRRGRITGCLWAGYGLTPATRSLLDAIETRFGELLADHVAGADGATALGRLANLLALLSRAATQQFVAARCDLVAVSRALDAVLAEPECVGLLPTLRNQAAADVVGGRAAVDELGARLLAWITSDVTQAYLSTIGTTERDRQESLLLEGLGRLAPDLVARGVTVNAGARFGGELTTLLRDVDEDGLTAELERALEVAIIDAPVATAGTARELAKLFKSGVKIGPAHVAKLHVWTLDSAVSVASHLRAAGAVSPQSEAFLRLAALELSDAVEPRAATLSAIPRMPAETRHFGNAGAVAAAAIAVWQLVDKGWGTPYVAGVGLLRDVVNGWLPAIDLTRAVMGWVWDSAAWVDAGKRWECVPVLVLWLQRGSAIVSIVTSGYAAGVAYQAGDYIGMTLFAAAAAANVWLLAALWMSTPTVVGVVLFGAPVIAVIAGAVTVLAVVWKLWGQPWMAEREQTPGYEALVREHRLMYAANVWLFPPVPVRIVSPMLGPYQTPVTPLTPLAVVEEVGGTPVSPPEWFAGGVAEAVLRVEDDETGTLVAWSPIPGTVYWLPGGIDAGSEDAGSEEDAPTDDPGDSGGSPPHGDHPALPGPPEGALVEIGPLFEAWLTGDPAEQVTRVDTVLGAWVRRGDPVAELTSRTGARDVAAPIDGRVVLLLPTGIELGDTRVAARIRAEGLEISADISTEFFPPTSAQ